MAARRLLDTLDQDPRQPRRKPRREPTARRPRQQDALRHVRGESSASPARSLLDGFGIVKIPERGHAGPHAPRGEVQAPMPTGSLDEGWRRSRRRTHRRRSKIASRRDKDSPLPASPKTSPGRQRQYCTGNRGPTCKTALQKQRTAEVTAPEFTQRETDKTIPKYENTATSLCLRVAHLPAMVRLFSRYAGNQRKDWATCRALDFGREACYTTKST